MPTNPDAPLVADVAQAAIKWQQAIHLAAQLSLRDREWLDPIATEVLEHWRTSWSFLSKAEQPYPDFDAECSVREWAARGLTAADMRDAIDRTVGKWSRDRYLKLDNAWRYFAGICWNLVTDIQERARQLIDRGDV